MNNGFVRTPRRRKYKFVGRSEKDNIYYWESVDRVSPGDSRVEIMRCDVDWFWSSLIK